ncbi:mechanosensitive ion channel family protein [Urechidicola vernalis]|uniref:Mechanosensitive ion channel n=1 Tax=Urechidicola vernalis TaxID=3075600 RepID=A0ABU2Y5J3_9FLAO|nr:mechanosensitive ion channel domain-containing protein [Urechidicola sp. P050]MDT0553035.1 mechanosensitive ion channel [Urechidicola sp. P050]
MIQIKEWAFGFQKKLFVNLFFMVWSSIIFSQNEKIDSLSFVSEEQMREEIDLSIPVLQTPNVSSPRETLFNFIENMNKSFNLLMEAHEENVKISGLYINDEVKPKAYLAGRYFDIASYSLDLSAYPRSLRKNLGYTTAIMLKEVLDRIDLPELEEVPGAYSLDSILNSNTKVSSYTIPNTEITITQIEEGDQEGKYLFSTETVSRVKEFYDRTKHLPYKSSNSVSEGFYSFYASTPGKLMPPRWSIYLPDWSKKEVLSQTIWQWLVLIFDILLSFFLVYLLYKYLFLKNNENISLKRTLFLIVIFVITIILGDVIERINLTGHILITLKVILDAVFWFVFALLSFNLIIAVSGYVVSSKHVGRIGIESTYTRAIFMIIAILVASSIIIFGLSELGIASVSIITGVGIGGLAIALAARSTLENLIASFTIFADKPYQVGDRVKIKDYNGTIEAIGIRSTQIRLLTGPVVSVPNEKMASIEIENIQKRPYLRREFDIKIKYESSRDIVEKCVEIIKDVLSIPPGLEADEFHPNVAINRPDYTPKVYFNKINDDSFNIYVNYWHFPPEHWEFMSHSESINFQIINQLNEANIEFAFPTNTVHLKDGRTKKESGSVKIKD